MKGWEVVVGREIDHSVPDGICLSWPQLQRASAIDPIVVLFICFQSDDHKAGPFQTGKLSPSFLVRSFFYWTPCKEVS